MAHESIWWGLYHGDRFLSLLLGLPYGISDSHCDLSMPDFGGEYMHPMVFVNNVSKLAGRVIDRNQGTAEQSFAWALQLDQELEDLWKKLDPAWLDFSELLATPENNAAELRERIMAQIIYHQIRVYLHLPLCSSLPQIHDSHTRALPVSTGHARFCASTKPCALAPYSRCTNARPSTSLASPLLYSSRLVCSTLLLSGYREPRT